MSSRFEPDAAQRHLAYWARNLYVAMRLRGFGRLGAFLGTIAVLSASCEPCKCEEDDD